MDALYLAVAAVLLLHAGSLTKLTSTSKCNRAIVNVIWYTHAFPAIISPNISCYVFIGRNRNIIATVLSICKRSLDNARHWIIDWLIINGY